MNQVKLRLDVPVAEEPQPDRRLRRVFAVRNWLSTVSGRFHARWRLPFDRKPKACAFGAQACAHAFGLRSNDGMFSVNSSASCSDLFCNAVTRELGFRRSARCGRSG